MKILFISSGNIQHTDVLPFVKAQAGSLMDLGHQVDFFPIRGRGLFGYFKNVGPLRRLIIDDNYDVLHAHYSLSGIVAAIAARLVRRRIIHRASPGRKCVKINYRPAVVVSLLGSDVNSKGFRRFLLRAISWLWDAIIVKSQEMKTKLGLKDVDLIPNGVDLERFMELDKDRCRADLGLDPLARYLLFAADPKREVKNFPLAKAAFSQLPTLNYQLLTLGTTPHHKIPTYLNACDVLVLTSKWEGSPNIVKEAMACNIPIVSTPVGDVQWLFGDLEGHYLADPNPDDVAAKLAEAENFAGRTRGRERLIALGLDAETVARKIVEVYERVVSS
ncbi:MAG: glycosyltransferase [Candidatus Cloacimonetes bacterium]|nr:glycosyltransferase [Candidatus Cloacimonadota bacterium]